MTYGTGSKLCIKHKMGLVEAACPYCEINRLRENIKHDIDVDQARINVEMENKSLRKALERIYALTHAFDDQNKYAEVLSGIAAEALQRA